MKYDVFLSYSRPDRDIATALQSQMQRYASPWYRARGLQIFRDDTDLDAAGGLGSSIQRALRESRWLVLVASPAAAGSPWVAQELEWWLDANGPSRLLIALVDGEIVWDKASVDFDRDRTTALPAVLMGRFPDEPIWIDLRDYRRANRGADVRLGDAIAGLVAPVRGVEKAELVGVHLRHRRRTRQLVTTTVIVLLLLLAAAIQQAVEASRQRDAAQEQARVATARQLASLAQSLVSTNLDLAQLFAVEAFRTDPNPQTRAALGLVSGANPHLVGFMPADSRVRAVAGSADRSFVIAGTENGSVHRWSTGATDGIAPRENVFRLDGPVVSVAVSGDGSTIVGTDGERAMVWSGGSVRPVTLPAGGTADAVAVSPSGRYVAACGPGSLVLFDLVTNSTYHGDPDEIPAIANCIRPVIPSDDEMVVYAGEDWARLSIPTLALVDRGRVGYPIARYNHTVANSGKFVAATTQGVIRVYPTAPGNFSPTIETEYNVGDRSRAEAVAVSDDARRMAVASSGRIFVVTPSDVSGRAPDVTTLDGLTEVNTNLLSFYGDEDHLLSASGETIALWDLTQYGRIGRHYPISLGTACNACSGPLLSISPDNLKVAVVSPEAMLGATALIIDSLGNEYVLPFKGKDLGAPVWLDEDRLMIPTTADADAVVVDGRGQLLGQWAEAQPGVGRVIAASVARDGNVVIVTATGTTIARSVDTGMVTATYPPPEGYGGARHASISPDGSVVVLQGYDREPSVLLDRRTGQMGELPGDINGEVAIAGDTLLVRRTDRVVEVRDLGGATVRRTLPAGRAFIAGMVVDNTGSLLAEQSTDGSVTVTDVASGARILTIALPVPGEVVGHTGWALSADGSTLVTVLEPGFPAPGNAIFWDLTGAGQIEHACRAAGRDLTAEEWQRYVGGPVPTNLACRR